MFCKNLSAFGRTYFPCHKSVLSSLAILVTISSVLHVSPCCAWSPLVNLGPYVPPWPNGWSPHMTNSIRVSCWPYPSQAQPHLLHSSTYGYAAHGHRGLHTYLWRVPPSYKFRWISSVMEDPWNIIHHGSVSVIQLLWSFLCHGESLLIELTEDSTVVVSRPLLVLEPTWRTGYIQILLDF